MISAIDLALMLLGQVLSTATTNKLPGEIVADVQAAVDRLMAVRNSPVSYQQLESLRVKPEW